MITCKECGGECCKKLAFQIEAPKNPVDYGDIKWYLYHKDVIVYIDNSGDWMVQVPIKCTKLDKNNRCTIYDERPPICRLSKVEECEKNTNEMDVVFRTVEDLEKYMKQKKII
jgi:Fe-S-cluster containining protein